MNSISFYTGQVSHQRFQSVRHRLNYKIAYVLVDLDRMSSANESSWVLGVGKGGLMSVRAHDHGDGKASDLAVWVRDYLHKNGVDKPAAGIQLLTLPRMFGYVFNPISVYFVTDEKCRLHHILYEVNNTFGERHFYLCATQESGGLRRHSCDKEFYVSPFFDVKGHYQFSVRPPNDTLALRIEYFDDSKRRSMTANLSARKKPVTNWNAVSILAQFPLMTLGVLAAIQWEALKLMIKGARFRPHIQHSESSGHNVNAVRETKITLTDTKEEVA